MTIGVSKDSSVGKEVGILSDLQIMERLIAEDDYCIFVSPLIDPGTQLGPSSLDLRLGTEFITMRTVSGTHLDLAAPGEQLRMVVKESYNVIRLPPDGKFVLHPGEFVLASTLEFLRLPFDIAGRLEGRSSIGRLGILVHATAGFVDPGFKGTLTYELINSGSLPIVLTPGKIRLGQICFFRTSEVQEPYLAKPSSKYGCILGAERTRIHLDPEIVGTSNLARTES